MRKILVACYGNTCRSPMLEGLLKRDLAVAGKEIVVESCGVLDKNDDAGANPHSITCMRERSIDITSHRRRFAGNLNLANYERIYVMGTDLRDEIVRLGALADRVEVLCESSGGVPNPFNSALAVDQQDMAKYIPCAAVLEEESARIAMSL
ncbi:MAG: hypothetical protein ABIP54_00075 [Candidatus Andersenbacteria bacterium]